MKKIVIKFWRTKEFSKDALAMKLRAWIKNTENIDKNWLVFNNFNSFILN